MASNQITRCRFSNQDADDSRGVEIALSTAPQCLDSDSEQVVWDSLTDSASDALTVFII